MTANRRACLPVVILALGVTTCAGCSHSVELADPVVLAEGAVYPAVAVDPGSGVVAVGWAEPDPTTVGYFQDHAGRLLVAISTDGARSFSRPVQVGPGAQVGSQGPVLSFADSGALYVAWEHTDPTRLLTPPGHVGEDQTVAALDRRDERVRVATSTDRGRTFSPPADVVASEQAIQGSMPSLAVAPGGKSVLVSWLDNTHAFGPEGTATERQTTPVRVALSADGGQSFEAPVIANSQSCSCCAPMLALFRDRPALVTRGYQQESREWDIRDTTVTIARDGGRTWALPVTVHADHWRLNGCPVVGPALGVDVGQRMHVVYYTGVSGRAGFWYANSDDGTNFSEPIRLSPVATPPAQNKVALAVDRDGNTWTALVDVTRKGGTIHLWRIDKRGMANEVVAARTAGGTPQLAGFQDGVVMVWTDPQKRLLLRRFRTPGP